MRMPAYEEGRGAVWSYVRIEYCSGFIAESKFSTFLHKY